jgi:hypothetical protein
MLKIRTTWTVQSYSKKWLICTVASEIGFCLEQLLKFKISHIAVLLATEPHSKSLYSCGKGNNFEIT